MPLAGQSRWWGAPCAKGDWGLGWGPQPVRLGCGHPAITRERRQGRYSAPGQPIAQRPGRWPRPVRQPMTLTFSAWGPFWPWVMSNSTCCPSSRLR